MNSISMSSIPADWPPSKEDLTKQIALQAKCREELEKEYGKGILDVPELRNKVRSACDSN